MMDMQNTITTSLETSISSVNVRPSFSIINVTVACNPSPFDNQRTNCELLNQGKQSATGSGETLACWDGYTDSHT
jgi:hypothetical protein